LRWKLERESGRAADLHAASAGAASDPSVTRTIRVIEVTAPAIVLGSTQPDEDVDREAADLARVEVARRRSGGGAVLVTRPSVLWVDLLLPAGDRLWEPDVGRAALWVGEAWAFALGSLGVGGAAVWTDRMVTTEWSSRVCFAGVAPGEVLLDGKKVLGVSQRRTRFASLFQTALLLEWRPEDLLGLLALSDGSRRRAEDELAPAATAVPGAAADLLEAFLAALPG
jgi:lipoate-protein ligase A